MNFKLARTALTLAAAFTLLATAHAADDPLKKAAAEKGAVVSESGLVFLSLREGKGASPVATDTVKVHYRGTFTDGREFDSSHKRGEPMKFGVMQVIKGWSEALPLMKEGAKWMLYIPWQLAYGEKGSGKLIGPNETLIFEIELIAVMP